jgi:O-methyltransferase
MVKKTFELTQDIIRNNVPGDFVECGVAFGAQIGAMSYACHLAGVKRTFHLYDSFEGIPLAGPKDDVQPGIGPISHDVNKPLNERLVSSGITVHSLEAVQKNVASWGFFEQEYKYHKGWFQDTLPKNTIENISFLRLDGDLYESTEVCLRYLAHKVSKGGYIVIDDYHLLGAKVATDDYIKDKDIELVRMPYAVATIEGQVAAAKDPNILTPVYWQVR